MVNWQDSHSLLSLTHFDGRNAAKLFCLRPYFSEFAWIKERIRVIVSYLAAVLPHLGIFVSATEKSQLLHLADSFTLSDAKKIVRIEKGIHHDLKALEEFVKINVPPKLKRYTQYINFGIGSEDINSIAFARLMTRSREEVFIPTLCAVTSAIKRLAQEHKNTNMIARTHAQPAGITTFGKELANPLLRLCDELKIFRSLIFQAKFSGEVGAYYGVSGVSGASDWLKFSSEFVASCGVQMQVASTQIAVYDWFVRYLHSMYRINAILADVSKNMWLYVLLGYVKIRKIEKEVGSAGMPHKVNPIYFEGAEGGLEVANGIIETLSRKLMINRLQRDFSDSTVRRSAVLAMAPSLLSYQSFIEAFKRLHVDRAALRQDLERHAEVYVEPLKVFLIRRGMTDAYEKLKRVTRGKTFTKAELIASVLSFASLGVSEKDVENLFEKISSNPYPGRVVDHAVEVAQKLQL